MKHDDDPSNFLNHRRPGTLLDEERGTTYLAPPVRGGSPPRLAAHASKELSLRSNNKTNRQNIHFQPPPTHHRRKFSDPPAPHIKQERAENDEPSSFYVNSRGEMQPAPNRPVLAAAQILQDDEPSQFHQTTTNTLQEGGGRGGTAAAAFDDEASTTDSIGDAWRRRGQQERQQERATPIVAVAVEASAATQPQSADDPSAICFLEVSQSRVLPAGDDAHYHHDRLGPRRSQFAVRPVSGLTQASVLSERTWATHDQFRSGLALGDPIYEEATAAVEGAEQGTQEAEQEPVLAAMQQFSLSQSKLQAEQAREQATAMAAQVQAVAPASIYSANPSPSPRWGQRDDSAKSVVSAPPALTTQGRSSSGGSSIPSQLPPPPRERASSASGVGAASVVSSNTAPSTDSTERLDRMKRNRVRLQRAAAVGGLVVGTVIASPVGAVAFAAGGYAVTRVGGRRRERRLRERLQQAENDDDDSSTQDETQSESQDYDIPLDNIFYTQRQTMTRQDYLRDSELEQKRLARFKPEGVQSRPTTTSFEAPPTLMSAPAVSPQSFPQGTRERLAKRSSM